MLSAQVEKIDGFCRRQSEHRSSTILLSLQVQVPARNSVQLVVGVKPQDIRDRLPLEDSRIHVELVACQEEHRVTAIRKTHRGLELLIGDLASGDRRHHFFAYQGPIALCGDCERCGQCGQREH